jgi:hypothetical protein
MTKKDRIPIPESTAAEIEYLSDRTCCVCTIRGKPIQIHHIDENPANNLLDNLAVLCLECHNETMLNGGFGRKLKAIEIKKIKSEWIQRVQERRRRADDLASISSVTGQEEHTESTDNDFLEYKTQNDSEILKQYLDKIIIVHEAQRTIAKTNWDTGVTAVMNQGSYDMIDFYQEVLIELATFYPKGHFDNKSPRAFFSEYVSSRFLWHRLVLEPDGQGTGGTIISTMTGGSVMDDLKLMVVEMVSALTTNFRLDNQIDFLRWRNNWTDKD